MKPNLNSLLIIVFGLLVCSIAFCGREKQDNISSSDTIVIHHFDTALKIIEKPTYHFLTKVYESKIPVSVDTSEIIKDYFTKYIAGYTFRDSSIEASVSDTIFKNSSTGMSLTYKWLKPTTTILNSTTITPLKNKVFAGFFLNYEKNISGGFSLSLLTKREKIFTGMYDPFNKEYRVGYSGKIKL